MKKFLTICLILLNVSVFAQQNKEEYIKKALELADEGKLQESNKMLIDMYSSNDLHDLVCYNLSLNYFNLKSYARAEKYATECLKMKSDYAMQASIIKGKCLDINGFFKDEENLYKEMIERNPKEFVFHNLLSDNMLKQNKKDEAEKELQISIEMNPFGSEAHLKLGNYLYDNELYIQSLLSYYYFLMTEPNSYRSREIVMKICDLMNFKEVDRVIAEKTANAENLSKQDNDLAWSLLFINNLKKIRIDEESELPEMHTFVDNSKDLIKNIVESLNNNEGFYEEFYVKFYAKLFDYYKLDVFLYYSLNYIYNDIKDAIPGITKSQMENFADFLSENYETDK